MQNGAANPHSDWDVPRPSNAFGRSTSGTPEWWRFLTGWWSVDVRPEEGVMSRFVFHACTFGLLGLASW